MALPLIKKTVSTAPLPLWQKILLLSSGGLLVLAGSGAFWSWKLVKRANMTLEARMKDLTDLDQKARTAGERLRMLKNDLRALKTLLEQHVAPVAFLKFLESTTHPGVYWKSLEVSFKEPRRMRVVGLGKTFDNVAEQIERVRQSEFIAASTIGAAKRGGSGRVEFSIELTPKPTIWKFKE